MAPPSSTILKPRRVCICKNFPQSLHWIVLFFFFRMVNTVPLSLTMRKIFTTGSRGQVNIGRCKLSHNTVGRLSSPSAPEACSNALTNHLPPPHSLDGGVLISQCILETGKTSFATRINHRQLQLTPSWLSSSMKAANSSTPSTNRQLQPTSLQQ